MVRRTLVLAAFVLLVDSLFAAAQSSIPQATDSTPGRITVVFSARSNDGKPAELSAADLEVKVDGKAAVVHDVLRLGRPDLRYCLLFDSSGSQRQRLQIQKQAATEILSKIVQPDRDFGTLIAFNDLIQLDNEGHSPAQIIQDVTTLRTFGGTALYDTAVKCANRLSQSQTTGTRVMFILSDGEDNASHINRDQTLNALVKAAAKIYVIGDVEGPIAIKAMRRFAEDSGGKVYLTRNNKDLDAAQADLSGELNSTLSVTLAPPGGLTGGRSYKLEIKTTKKGVKITNPHQWYVPAQ